MATVELYRKSQSDAVLAFPGSAEEAATVIVMRKRWSNLARRRHEADGAQGDRQARPLPDPPAVTRPGPRRLTGPELLDWIALRRVYQGSVAMLGAHYLDHGRKVPCFLPETFGRLDDTELTRVLEPDHPGGLRRVAITSQGRVRYQELNAMHRSFPCPDQSPGDWSVLPDRPLLRSRPVRDSPGETAR
ncbi:MAG: hypothetical protein ACRDTC_20015 [Pseudonocardiaceae bacterium]